ncbi:hypothetical protein AB4407_11220 [Vibrio sp. 10N.261.46.E11]|uniref:hypothetical protein n=1 Tax=Vibrio sp. 10N.261.46.E11 TaxID=3229662 RepID=UPI00354E4CAF
MRVKTSNPLTECIRKVFLDCTDSHCGAKTTFLASPCSPVRIIGRASLPSDKLQPEIARKRREMLKTVERCTTPNPAPKTLL